MIRSFFIFTLLTFLFSPLAVQAAKDTAPPTTSKTLSAQFNTITATVIGIDKATHTLTLKNDIGEQIKVQVDPEKVKNFDNIKNGDVVVIRQAERLALSLSKKEKGEKPGIGASVETETAPKGAKPGAEAEKTVQISAKIVKIDPAKQIVSLKGPEGNIIPVKVRDPKNLEGLKKGDMVAATYTKVLAVSVEPAPKK